MQSIISYELSWINMWVNYLDYILYTSEDHLRPFEKCENNKDDVKNLPFSFM